MGLFNYFNEYPYRNIEDINLDWLFTNYQKLRNDLDALNEWMSTHKEEYAEAITRLAAVENEIATFEATVNAEFASLESSLRNEFAALKIEIEKELSDTKKEIIDEFNRSMVEFTNEFLALKTAVENEIREMEMVVRRAILELENVVKANNEYVFNHVQRQLDEFIQNLPDYENLIVHNPVRGEDTNVQTAIYDLYSMFCVFGLTAAQYDSLQLTAEEYDNMQLTAKEYDQYGYKLLNYPDEYTHMRDPFTGKIVPNKVVIYELSELHREALTAAEYDALELLAEDYDAFELTAYWYDWHGIDLLSGGITAGEYDFVELTAAEYDALNLSAYIFDNYSKFLIGGN